AAGADAPLPEWMDLRLDYCCRMRTTASLRISIPDAPAFGTEVDATVQAGIAGHMPDDAAKTHSIVIDAPPAPSAVVGTVQALPPLHLPGNEQHRAIALVRRPADAHRIRVVHARQPPHPLPPLHRPGTEPRRATAVVPRPAEAHRLRVLPARQPPQALRRPVQQAAPRRRDPQLAAALRMRLQLGAEPVADRAGLGLRRTEFDATVAAEVERAAGGVEGVVDALVDPIGLHHRGRRQPAHPLPAAAAVGGDPVAAAVARLPDRARAVGRERDPARAVAVGRFAGERGPAAAAVVGPCAARGAF